MSYCHKCGNLFVEGDKFCQKCGLKISSISNEKIDSREANNDPSELQIANRQRKVSTLNKNKFFISVFLIIVLIVGFVKAENHSFNSEKSNAEQIANWLIENKYCSNIDPERPESSPGLESLRVAYDNGLYRLCTITPANGISLNKRLEGNYGENQIMGYMGIYVGSGRMTFTRDGKKIIPRYLNEIVGENWKITVSSYESRYLGSSKLLAQWMTEIAEKLNGKVSALHRPDDYCALISDLMANSATSDSQNIRDFFSDCLEFAPEALDRNASETWPD